MLFITHIVPDTLPSKGLRKLFFYTAKEETTDSGPYYWGSGNNGFDRERIERMTAKGLVIKLHTPVLLLKKMSIWVDSEGNYYTGNTFEPFKDKQPLFNSH